MNAFVGCSGWFYWHWRNLFYPEEIPTHRWFRHYTENFDTVELNAPFYRWPEKATVRRWVRDASPGFKYTVKVNGLITHERRFVGTAKLVQEFYQIADTLGELMGCFLFQLPPSYRYHPARLATILRQLNTNYKNVVEFRHKTWWRENVYRAFRDAGVCFCSVSGPRLPEELVQTTPWVYLRFHGRTKWYRYNYSEEELAEWVSKVQAISPEEVWAYFNNDREAHAIHNAKTLRGMLQGAEARPEPAIAAAC